MSLHAPAFDRTLRRAAREACRADPTLRAAYRRARRRSIWKRSIRASAHSFLLSFLLVAAVCGLLGRHDAPAAAVPATIGLWWLATALLGRASVLLRTADLPAAVLLLPLARTALERHLSSRLLWLMPRSLTAALLAFLPILLILHGHGTSTVLALVLAALYAATAWSASLWLALVPVPTVVQSAPLWLPFIAFLVVRATNTAPVLLAWFFAHAEHIAAVLPGAWIASSLLASFHARPFAWFWSLALLLPFAASGWWALRLVTRRAQPEASLLWSTFNELEEDGLRASFNEALTTHQQAEEAARAAGSDPFAPAEWSRQLTDDAQASWIERLVLRWTTARERLVLECIATELPRWSRLAAWGFGLVVAGALLVQAGRHTPMFPGVFYIAGGAALVFGVVMGGPLASGFNRAFGGVAFNGMVIEPLALLPIDFREVVVLTVKAAVVRGVLFAPVMGIGGLLLAAGTSFAPTQAAWLGIKAGLLLTAFAPWLAVLACASKSNDTELRTWRAFRVLVLLLGNSLVLVALAAATLLAHAGYDLAALVVFALAAGMGALRYRSMLSRGWFDLAHVARPAE